MSVTKNYKEMLKAADVDGLIRYFKQVFVNKYYDLYSEQLEIDGMEYQPEYRLKALLWKDGTAWIRKNPIGEAVVCQYTGIVYNYNNFPINVQLVGKNNPPESEIPMTPQIVDKDGVILWIRKCHKGYEEDVNYYIGKLAEAETAITICLALQRTPWLLSSEPENIQKLKDLVRRILNNELVIFTDIPKNEIDQLNLNAPWIIDKITEYQKGVENDIKTLLGVDNQGGYLNREQQNLDTTNSNNDEINDMSNGPFKELQKHLDRANKILGLNSRVKQTSQPVTQIGIKKEQIDGKDDLLDLQ